jgi:hypothetical protein
MSGMYSRANLITTSLFKMHIDIMNAESHKNILGLFYTPRALGFIVYIQRHTGYR